MTDEAQALVVPEKPRLSISQLGSFLRCGEQYRLERIERAPQTPAAWRAGGTAFHAGFEFWEKAGRPLDTADTLEHAVWTFDQEVESMKRDDPDIENWLTGGRTKPKDDLKRRRDKVPEQVAQYIIWASAQAWRPWEAPNGQLGIEYPFEIEFADTIVIGRIDIIAAWPDGTLEVVDPKTGAKQPKDQTQLGVYALGIEADTKGEFRPEFGYYYMAKDGKTTHRVDLSGYTFEKVQRWFSNLATAKALQLLIPHPADDACIPCSVSRFCDAIDGADSGLYHPDLDVRAEALGAYYEALGNGA